MLRHIIKTCIFGALLVPGWLCAQPISEVVYQNQHVRLAKTYLDFDTYKNDPKNLTASAQKHAETLIRKAMFGPRFKSMNDASAALDQIQFPGYGTFYANQIGARIDRTLELAYVEIPGGKLNRYLVLQLNSDGTALVVDDFVADQQPEIARVKRDAAGELVYRNLSGQIIVPARR